jgi:hypothetical protein
MPSAGRRGKRYRWKNERVALCRCPPPQPVICGTPSILLKSETVFRDFHREIARIKM